MIIWVLLLQEFDLETKDKNGGDNVIVDHLSRLEKTIEKEKGSELEENFPDKQLFLLLAKTTRYADIVNCLACELMIYDFSCQQKKEVKD